MRAGSRGVDIVDQRQYVHFKYVLIVDCRLLSATLSKIRTSINYIPRNLVAKLRVYMSHLFY